MPESKSVTLIRAEIRKCEALIEESVRKRQDLDSQIHVCVEREERLQQHIRQYNDDIAKIENASR